MIVSTSPSQAKGDQACTQKKTLIWNVPNSQRFMNTASEDCKTFKRMEKNEIK